MFKLVVAAVLSGLVWAGAAKASPSGVVADITDDGPQLIQQVFDEFAELLGSEPLPLPADTLAQAIDSALPRLAEDDERSWGATIDFDITLDETTGTLAPLDAISRAEACPNDSEAQVVAFERLSLAGYQGHQCLFVLEQPGMAATYSRIFLERDNRRVMLIQGVAMVIEGDTTDAAILMAERRPAMGALARLLAGYAALMAESAPGDSLDRSTVLDRLNAFLDQYPPGEGANAAPQAPPQ